MLYGRARCTTSPQLKGASLRSERFQGIDSGVFATRLTRLTRAARDRRFGSSALRMIRDVQDWGGRTRIGEALRTFNVRWARRVMRNGPVILIVSDGWDRGEPSLLMREIARLRRSSRRLI